MLQFCRANLELTVPCNEDPVWTRYFRGFYEAKRGKNSLLIATPKYQGTAVPGTRQQRGAASSEGALSSSQTERDTKSSADWGASERVPVYVCSALYKVPISYLSLSLLLVRSVTKIKSSEKHTKKERKKVSEEQAIN